MHNKKARHMRKILITIEITPGSEFQEATLMDLLPSRIAAIARIVTGKHAANVIDATITREKI